MIARRMSVGFTLAAAHDRDPTDKAADRIKSVRAHEARTWLVTCAIHRRRPAWRRLSSGPSEANSMTDKAWQDRTSKRRPKRASNRWSAYVTTHSNALDLEPGVFKARTSDEIARSLKRSAERSRRRKTTPFRSAMSMLNLYINRAGRGLTQERKSVLEDAKSELRKLYRRGKSDKPPRRRPH